MRRLSKYLSSPVVLNYTLPVLMIYLIVGTVSQKYIGLYDATQIFFSSAVVWLGVVPLPGLPIFIVLILLNLIFKLIFKSPWTVKNAGTIIVHIGVMLLLFGGGFTALFSDEGYIDLGVGERKAVVTDYHRREFVLLDETGREVYKIRHKEFSEGQEVLVPNPPIKINVLETCRNCRIEKRRFVQDNYVGMAQHMQLVPDRPRQEDEENMAGLTFFVSGADTDGVYLVLESVPKFPEITVLGQTYQFVLRRQNRTLPFQVELLDFKRGVYPGTNLAKFYESRVRITDGDAQWESLISMNEPLRYKGYTFFQSSFIETPKGDVSVLAVVWNAGRAFPYVSGIVICLGMIVHLFVRQRKPARTLKGKPAHAV